MAGFLLFPSRAEAIAAEAKASDNVRRAIASIAPERLAPDGSIFGINAATWAIEPAAQRTERWAVPAQVADGWVMPVPDPAEIAPIPVSVFLAGVGGQEVEALPPTELDPPAP